MIIRFFNRKEKPQPKPKSLTEAIVQESGRHITLKKWIDGSKTAAIVIVAILSVAFMFIDTAKEKIGPHVAVINLTGAIETGSKQTDGWKVSRLIKEAMESDNVKAIVIEANSPGGSPTDAEHIFKTIMSYRGAKEGKPIYMAVRGVCASACYYIGSATDAIFAHDSSLIGSIGVKMEGWDLRQVMQTVGVERRIYHAGEHKALLDPFKAVSDEENEFIQNKLLFKLHRQFINSVKAGRGDRLSDNKDLFTGLIWTGEEALELGLIDNILTPTEMEDLIKQRHHVDNYIYHGKQKFDLSNILSMDSQDVFDAIGMSVYHAFKTNSENGSINYRFE